MDKMQKLHRNFKKVREKIEAEVCEDFDKQFGLYDDKMVKKEVDHRLYELIKRVKLGER